MPIILLIILFFSSSLQATAPPIQLATKYHDDITISDYWVSEKLDGVRAYWNGADLISRQGYTFQAPAWFTEDFPNIPLDGELWIARSKFEEVSAIVRTYQINEDEWKKITFMIFDLPSSLADFSSRLLLIEKLLEKSPSPYLKMIPQQSFANQEALQQRLDEVIDNGGEGLMLHHKKAYYQVKRSEQLMKLKRYDDAEAVVIGHIPGKGKNVGKLGSLLVKYNHDIVFKIGSGFSDKQRQQPPEIGSTITFQYIGKTKNGVPRFASYLRIRNTNMSK